jgi:maltooligosyltrehalose trehalohydrolase
VAWITVARTVEVRLFDDPRRALRTEALEPCGDHRFERHLEGVEAGALYDFVLDGVATPDPYGRFLPSGIHGPTRVVAPARARAMGNRRAARRSVLARGADGGVKRRLDAIAELGFRGIELMPVAAFPGEHGWGYDGVALHAPFAAYGEADDLRSWCGPATAAVAPSY